jgi:hypothetical protein
VKAIYKHEHIAEMWQQIVKEALRQREKQNPCLECEERNCNGCWDNFPINASSNCCGYGHFDEKGYSTGTGFGEYIFTPEGMVFDGRRNSFLTGSDCVHCSAQGVWLSIDDIEKTVTGGEWELLESTTPDRGLFERADIPVSPEPESGKVVGRKVKVKRICQYGRLTMKIKRFDRYENLESWVNNSNIEVVDIKSVEEYDRMPHTGDIYNFMQFFVLVYREVQP